MVLQEKRGCPHAPRLSLLLPKLRSASAASAALCLHVALPRLNGFDCVKWLLSGCTHSRQRRGARLSAFACICFKLIHAWRASQGTRAVKFASGSKRMRGEDRSLASVCLSCWFHTPTRLSLTLFLCFLRAHTASATCSPSAKSLVACNCNLSSWTQPLNLDVTRFMYIIFICTHTQLYSCHLGSTSAIQHHGV